MISTVDTFSLRIYKKAFYNILILVIPPLMKAPFNPDWVQLLYAKYRIKIFSRLTYDIDQALISIFIIQEFPALICIPIHLTSGLPKKTVYFLIGKQIYNIWYGFRKPLVSLGFTSIIWKLWNMQIYAYLLQNLVIQQKNCE